MDKKSNNPEKLKQYTNQLRDMVDSYDVLSKNDLRSLRKSYDLSEDDLIIIENFIDKKITEATNYFEYGEWDNAINAIEEANYKDPFNKETLKLYYDILMEKTQLLGQKPDDKKVLNLILKRLSMVDRHLYNRLVKESKSSNKKISKLWLLSFIVLVIPVLIFFPRDNKITKEGNLKTNFINHLGEREIAVNYIPLHHESDLQFQLKSSTLDGNSSNYYYTLNFYLFSEEHNIMKVKGLIKWIDFESKVILTEDFETSNIEFYKKELIPISYRKTSHRLTPNLDNIVIEIKSIISSTGKDRVILKEIPVFNNGANTFSVKIKEAGFFVTSGVSSKYLSLDLLIDNTSSEVLDTLIGELEWLDDFSRVISKNKLELLNNTDVPIYQNETRLINRVIELEDSSISSYRINIKEGL